MYKNCPLDTAIPEENRYDEWLDPEQGKLHEEYVKLMIKRASEYNAKRNNRNTTKNYK